MARTENEMAEEYTTRWQRAAHAMQSGVAARMNWAERDETTEPKHLRVGVNSALVDHGALVDLLVSKGVITRLEYLRAIAEGMEREQASYERDLSALLGHEVKLG